ncbi:unnamed protein product [Toxocara canis]|uniref:Cadherin domain-containing protein n=1 Tax=Toxocara canis TaxID=6265 RepID=A0A183VHN0_TOXCA|nr:unnamed protein product [Toxocara canis]
MDQDSGWLMVAEVLDRETEDEHVIVVIASDEGRLSSRRNLTVIVTDANDSPALFDRNNYLVVVDFDKLSIGQQHLHMIVAVSLVFLLVFNDSALSPRNFLDGIKTDY